MLSVFNLLAIANIVLGAAVGFIAAFHLGTNGSKFKFINIFVLIVSCVEIFCLLFMINASVQYPQLFFTILTQMIWSCALLYVSMNSEALARKNLFLQHELEKHQRLYEEIKSVALSDGLTNIANRRNFDMFLKTELHRAASLKQPVSLIIMDLDKFKIYNDTFGHLTGDKLLSQVGQILSHNVRAIDLPARYGGEEFSIILPEIGLKDAVEVAEKLRVTIEGSNFPDHSGTFTAKITASFGIATYDPTILTRQPDSEKIISIADKALYKAKQAGRNRVFASTIFQ